MTEGSPYGSVKDPDYDYRFNWLASYPKSGNTWLRCLIHAYREGRLDINNLQGTDDVARIPHQTVAAKQLDYLTPYEAVAIRPAALLQIMAMHATFCMVRPIVKTHWANVLAFNIPVIPRPVTRSVIHLVRDPRDVAVSFAHHSAEHVDTTIEKMGHPETTLTYEGLVQNLTSWSNHVRSWQAYGEIEGVGYTQVRYEDLLADPEGELASVMAMLEHPDSVNHDRVKQAVELASFESLQRQEAEKGFLEVRNGRFFRQGKAGGWRDVLTHEQARCIEADHGEVMAELGYL